MFVQSLREREVVMQSSSMKPKAKLLSGESATGAEATYSIFEVIYVCSTSILLVNMVQYTYSTVKYTKSWLN